MADLTGPNPDEVGGVDARGVAITAKPVLVGARGSGTLPSAVTAGQSVDLWAGLSGNLFVTLVDTSGSYVSVGGGTQYTGDAAATATPTGTIAMGLANTSAPTDVSAANDAVALWASPKGALNVILRDTAGAAVATGTQYTEDGALGTPVGTAIILHASTAVPAAMSADGDAVAAWANRNGAQVITMAPHVGIQGSPWTLTSKTAQYTSTQTSADLIAAVAATTIVVTAIQIQAGGTTAGAVQVYFGTGAYSRGTNKAVFDGEFAPSATLKPGVVMQGPFIGASADALKVTTSAAINPITVTVWYYVVT